MTNARATMLLLVAGGAARAQRTTQLYDNGLAEGVTTWSWDGKFSLDRYAYAAPKPYGALSFKLSDALVGAQKGDALVFRFREEPVGDASAPAGARTNLRFDDSSSTRLDAYTLPLTCCVPPDAPKGQWHTVTVPLDAHFPSPVPDAPRLGFDRVSWQDTGEGAPFSVADVVVEHRGDNQNATELAFDQQKSLGAALQAVPLYTSSTGMVSPRASDWSWLGTYVMNYTMDDGLFAAYAHARPYGALSFRISPGLDTAELLELRLLMLSAPLEDMGGEYNAPPDGAESQLHLRLDFAEPHANLTRTTPLAPALGASPLAAWVPVVVGVPLPASGRLSRVSLVNAAGDHDALFLVTDVVLGARLG